MAKKDYYKVLGISKSANDQEIKQAYRKLAKKYHPDINKNHDAEEKFKEINEAASVLTDSEKRAQYDQFGHAAFDGSNKFSGQGGFSDFFSNMGGTDFSDIFSDFFSSGNNSSRREKSKGQDIGVEVTLSFNELLFGTNRQINLNLLKKCAKCNGFGAEKPSDIKICNKCNGHGQIVVNKKMGPFQVQNQVTCDLCYGVGKQFKSKCIQCYGKGIEYKKEAISLQIPKGLKPGQQIMMRNAGHASTEEGPNGDLYITIKVQHSNVFEIANNGVDLIMNYNISFVDAILGNDVEIKTFDKNIRLKVPKGINSGQIIKVNNKGLFKTQTSEKRGDLLIKINLVIPSSISKKKKKKKKKN